MTAAQSVTAAFSTATTATTSQETSPAITYNGWKGVTDASASGGAYRHSNTTGAKSAFKFTGTSVTWLSLKGPSRGIAKVTVDGVSKGTVDLYAASVGRFTKTFSGLSSAAHTIAVQVTGTKNATATGTWVAVDGFTVGSATTQESSRAVAFDSWAGAASTSASGGEYRASGTAGATAAFTFTGSSVDWLTAVGPGWGKAEVYIDGTDKGTVDLYAATLHWQTTKTYSGLGTGSHTITIKALGTKNASANSTKVPVDAFVVR
jgi:bacillopeptidase F